jgi:hypothetical protein
MLRPLLVVHDQLPTPRATVWWPVGRGGEDLRAALPQVVVAPRATDLRTVFIELIRGVRPSDPPLLPDVDPAPWRGVGPYGQGGSGMTGGVPFGRPLPGRSPDPDGLELDQLPLHLGPFFPPLPPGLMLDIGLQGDVVRTASVNENPFMRRAGDPAIGPLDSVLFIDALAHPVPVAALELGRARHHLRWAASAVRLHGLHPEARRLAFMAEGLTVDDARSLRTFASRLGRRRSLASAMEGIGVLRGGDAGSGPVARASGAGEDGRSADPAYAGLGFEPVGHQEGDAWARFRQRLAEAVQAVEIAGRSSGRMREPGGPVEGPRGPLRGAGRLPSAGLVDLLPGLLVGQEWGDAMTTVVSLDIDMEEAASGVGASVVSQP